MVEFVNVNKAFFDKKIESFSIKNLTFKTDNEVLGIVGKSGSGKSTILQLLTGILNVDSGNIYFNGIDITTLKPNKKLAYLRDIGFIFQKFNLLTNLTVIENITLPLKIIGIKKNERIKRGLELIEYIGLSSLENRYPHQLSGGQLQRVAIARALINNPKILLCDEITSALDQETYYEILSLLLKIKNDLNLSIIFVSHDLNVIKMICDRVLVIENGLLTDTINLPKKSFKSFEFDYKTILESD
ncbi:ATP-binding cassette domain-containing protein [Haploplasma axanthum]|uniref:ABC transporter ATP-binding protein n=1 Tax=Haploplasma axanthum TaxID=29552 RepID=A0A449BE88_HAPAX|nr:ATP-binding cassette domain-containing protein [Haploplasma axanthum]VEU80746.1 ABC transporter ATP-binding protein [Haploplasma axanthum]